MVVREVNLVPEAVLRRRYARRHTIGWCVAYGLLFERLLQDRGFVGRCFHDGDEGVVQEIESVWTLFDWRRQAARALCRFDRSGHCHAVDHAAEDGQVHRVARIEYLPLRAEPGFDQHVMSTGDLQEQDVHEECRPADLF